MREVLVLAEKMRKKPQEIGPANRFLADLYGPDISKLIQKKIILPALKQIRDSIRSFAKIIDDISHDVEE